MRQRHQAVPVRSVPYAPAPRWQATLTNSELSGAL